MRGCRRSRGLGIAAASAMLMAGLAGCNQTDADVASKNLSTASEQFEINRRIVFVNGITDKYFLEIQGRCSIEVNEVKRQLEVTCKTGPEENEQGYKKHFLGLSDNTTYFLEQLEPAKVDVYHYKVIFKPEAIVPDIDLKTSGEKSQ